MKHIDYKGIFDKTARDDFERDNVVLGVLTQLGTEVYHVLGAREQDYLNQGVRLYWNYHAPALAPKTGCYLVLPIWTVSGREFGPMNDAKLQIPPIGPLNSNVQTCLSNPAFLTGESSTPAQLAALHEAKTHAVSPADFLSVASGFAAFAKTRALTETLHLWRVAQWGCSTRDILSWAWLFGDGCQEKAKGLELGVLAMHTSSNFCEGYESAFFLSQLLASEDKDLIEGAMLSVEERFLLADLEDPALVVHARRHASMFAKRWLSWAANPRRARCLIVKIMNCVSSLRQNQWEKLLHMASVMQDDELIQDILRARNRRGVLQDNWVV